MLPTRWRLFVCEKKFAGIVGVALDAVVVELGADGRGFRFRGNDGKRGNDGGGENDSGGGDG